MTRRVALAVVLALLVPVMAQAGVVKMWTAGGGMSEATADGLYLKLTGSNDPITGQLDVNAPLQLDQKLGTEVLTQTCAGWGLAAPVGAWSCAADTITRTASGADLTITNSAAVVGTTYKVVIVTATVTAGSVTASMGGATGTAITTATTTTEYFTATATTALTLTASATFAGTITVSTTSAKAITSTISSDVGPLVMTSPGSLRFFPASGFGATVYGDFTVTGTCTGCGGGGASAALDNLAAVAINTSLVSDTANTDDLGSAAIEWRSGYFGISLLLGTAQEVSLLPRAAAILQLGAADSATPVAQTLTAQGSRGGTDTNVAAPNMTIAAPLGTGTGTPSALVITTPTVAASGTTQQTAATRLMINSTASTFANPVIVEPTASGGANAFKVDTTSGASFTQINDNGTVVIDSDVATGTYPLTAKYNNIVQGRITYQGDYEASRDVLAARNVSPSTVTSTLGSASQLWAKLYVDYTNTATVGAVTINKAAGRVRIAAAGSSVVVTNSVVTAASHVFAMTSTNDATCSIKNVVPAAGSFTLTTTAACTAETTFDFFVVNAD